MSKLLYELLKPLSEITGVSIYKLNEMCIGDRERLLEQKIVEN